MQLPCKVPMPFLLLLFLLFSFTSLPPEAHQLTKNKKKAAKANPHYKPKIYDCFTFFNEFELLEIRLNELNDVVDYFVLVEMDETFQGDFKPLHFGQNQHRFEKFLHKILYVPVTDRVEVHDNTWEREKFQRDQIARALKNCHDQDIILISDLDEVISHQAIPRILEGLKDHHIVACQIAFYVYFFLNAKEKNNGGIRPLAMRYRQLKKKSIDDLRKRYIFHIPSPPLHPPHIVYNTGWHFSSMGGLARFIQKLDSWSHTPQNTPSITPEWRTQNLSITACVTAARLSRSTKPFPDSSSTTTILYCEQDSFTSS